MTQEEALTILRSGANVFLTGAAGSGKTYLLNRFIKQLKRQKVKLGVTASTGIAATHIGGMTVHAWTGIGIRNVADESELKKLALQSRTAKRLKNTQVLIIDEISMLDADRLELIDQLLRAARGSHQPFGGMQVVLSGDFFQLPPIAKPGQAPRFAYQSPVWQALDLKICYLTEQHRQGDQNFLQLLNTIRDGSANRSMYAYLEQHHLNRGRSDQITKLYPHNRAVDHENLLELEDLPGREQRFEMIGTGRKNLLDTLKKGCLAPEILRLKPEAVVMFVRNNLDKGYVNGTSGQVSGWTDSGYPIIITTQGRSIIAEPETWIIEEDGKQLASITQLPLRLAWALTVHKSQGVSLDRARIDLSAAFEPGMGYVALSRVRSLEGLELIGLNQTALQVRPEIIELDETLRQQSSRLAQDLEEKPEVFTPYWQATEKPSYTYQKLRQHHRSAYQKWTPEEDGRLVQGFRAGRSVKELSVIHGRKPSAIYSRLRKLELKKQ